jgi:short-subunit dehydrogenase
MTSRDELQARYGPVALVTGASSGIGEQFARLLAEAGLDLVLTARRGDRLRALADELGERHGVDVLCIEADLADRAALGAIFEACRDRDVGLVVSNAGAVAKGLHHETPSADLEALVDVNCRAPALLAHALAPALIERGRGGFLITASIEAYTPSPHSAAYAASKAFARFLGEALWAELGAFGIDVLVLSPGATDTEALPRSGMRAADMPTPVMTARDVAKEGLARLGDGPAHVAGRFNRVFTRMLGWLPTRWAIRAVGRGMQDAIEKGRRAG